MTNIKHRYKQIIMQKNKQIMGVRYVLGMGDWQTLFPKQPVWLALAVSPVAIIVEGHPCRLLTRKLHSGADIPEVAATVKLHLLNCRGKHERGTCTPLCASCLIELGR